MKRYFMVVSVFSFLLTAVFGVSSAFSAEKSMYAGINFGRSSYDYPQSNDIGFNLIGGYIINSDLSLEAGWVSLGKAEGKDLVSKIADEDGVKIKAEGLHIDAVPMVHINEKGSVFGKVGLILWNSKIDLVNGNKSESESGTGLLFGFGYQHDIQNNLKLCVQFEQYNLGIFSDASLLSAGITYEFTL